MRKKELKLVVAFHTTADAMAMEKSCKEKGVPGRLIPVPRSISAGCGLAWCVELSERTQIQMLLNQAGIEAESLHECMVWFNMRVERQLVCLPVFKTGVGCLASWMGSIPICPRQKERNQWIKISQSIAKIRKKRLYEKKYIFLRKVLEKFKLIRYTKRAVAW